MKTPPTAESLLDLERDLEADIIECLKLLEKGEAEALAELNRSRDHLDVSVMKAMERLHRTAHRSHEEVEDVQHVLGQLNLALHGFVLTKVTAIENLNAFDAWRERVVTKLQEAREAIERIEADGDRKWSEEFVPVWDRFRRQLDVVRIQLAADQQYAERELETLQGELRERVAAFREELRHDPAAARDVLFGGPDEPSPWSDLGGWVRALWMWQDRWLVKR